MIDFYTCLKVLVITIVSAGCILGIIGLFIFLIEEDIIKILLSKFKRKEKVEEVVFLTAKENDSISEDKIIQRDKEKMDVIIKMINRAASNGNKYIYIKYYEIPKDFSCLIDLGYKVTDNILQYDDIKISWDMNNEKE